MIKGEFAPFKPGHASVKHPKPYYLVNESGCWIWQRATNRNGYGIMMNTLAHRIFYERHRGPIPAGLLLDHLCHNADPGCPGGRTCLHRRCVNPAHLEPASNVANILRSGRTNANKTHCKRGHPFDEANTMWFVSPNGNPGRKCRACTKALMAAYYQEHKATWHKRRL